MKTKLLFLVAFLLTAVSIAQQITVSPNSFEEDQEITLNFSGLDVQEEWGTSDVYLWAWHYDANGNQINNPEATGTDFINSPESAKFTDNGDGTYSYTFTPTTFYDATGISRIGLLAKSQNGTKQTDNFYFNVGTFLLNLDSPTQQVTIVEAGSSFNRF